MSFYKNDYVDTQRKRNIIIASAIVGVILILAFSVLKKSPETEKTGDKAQVNIAKPSKKDTEPGKKKDMPAIIKEVRQSVVLIKTYDIDNNPLGVGTGFFITESGNIISNSHVFQGSHHAEAVTARGKIKIEKVLAQDNQNDLVRLSVVKGSKKFKPLTMSDSTPQVGENIMVIGNPLGLEATVTNGIVSALRNYPPFGRVIQISCPISPGSSGSPVLNMDGEVIGVATFQMASGQNLNFAIPIAYAKKLKPLASKDIAAATFKGSGSFYDQGLELFSRQQYQDAISFFQEAINQDPKNAEAYYHLGVCLRETRKTDAVDTFKKAIELKPDYADAYCELGLTYIQFNMKGEALNILRKARDLSPENDKVLVYLGIAYCVNDQFSIGTKMLEKSLDIYADKNAYFYLGMAYTAQTQHDKAIWAFKNCLQMDPENIEAYVALGASYLAVENWLQGIKAMNEAVLKAPENPQIHFILGFLHLGNNDLPSAELELKYLNQSKGGSDLRSKLSHAISEYKRYYRIK